MERTTRLTTEMVRVLAHPLRTRLLGLLRVEGPATASQLAERLGTNSGATSYHLRQLADVGLVVEDEQRGTARERWWEAAHDSHSWTESEHEDDPDGRAAADWLVRYAHRQYVRRVEDWLDVRSDWPQAWRDVAELSDYRVNVTPDQLAELNRRIGDLLREYEEAAAPDDPRAELFGFVLASFPYRAVSL